MKTKGLLFVIGLLFLNTIIGMATIIKETRKTDSFKNIKVESGIDVYFTQKNAQNIEVEASDNIIKDIITEIENETLVIKRMKKNLQINKKVKVYVSAPAINEVELSGGSDFQTDNLNCDNDLKIRASGGSDIHIGRLTVSATTDIGLSGGSDCEIKYLQTSRCNIAASGGSDSDIDLYVSEKISVAVSGGSDIKLSGKANDLSLNASGGSDIDVRKLTYSHIITNKSGGSDIYQ